MHRVLNFITKFMVCNLVYYFIGCHNVDGVRREMLSQVGGLLAGDMLVALSCS